MQYWTALVAAAAFIIVFFFHEETNFNRRSLAVVGGKSETSSDGLEKVPDNDSNREFSS
jgi:hypothetical protein